MRPCVAFSHRLALASYQCSDVHWDSRAGRCSSRPVAGLYRLVAAVHGLGASRQVPSHLSEDPKVGPEARRLFDDAQGLLHRIVNEKLLRARAVYGFWPAASAGNDILVYEDAGRRIELARFHMLRQQWQRKGQEHFLSLADFIAPREAGCADYLGAFAVTAGIGSAELARHFEASHDDYNAIMVKALADRLAEVLAERLHQLAQIDWGYGRDERLSSEDLIDEKYRGIRPAPGYPACPDHTEKRTLFTLLEAEKHTGIRLTDGMAMDPPASVCGFYFAHPRLAVLRRRPADARPGRGLRTARPSASPTWNALWRPTSATSPRRGEVEKRNRKKKIKELIAGSPPGTPRGVDRRESDVSPAFGLLGLGSSVGRIPGVRLEAVSSRACKRGSRSSVASDPGNPSVAITKRRSSL